MFSSEKFLSPIVTAGLPTPGPLAAGPDAPVVALELELVDDELLLPQAVRPATTASAAEPLATRVLNLPDFVPLIRRLLLVGFRLEDHWCPQASAASAGGTRAGSCSTRRSPRGVSARWTSVSTPSTASARAATQMAAPSTPEKW